MVENMVLCFEEQDTGRCLKGIPHGQNFTTKMWVHLTGLVCLLRFYCILFQIGVITCILRYKGLHLIRLYLDIGKICLELNSLTYCVLGYFRWNILIFNLLYSFAMMVFGLKRFFFLFLFLTLYECYWSQTH